MCLSVINESNCWIWEYPSSAEWEKFHWFNSARISLMIWRKSDAQSISLRLPNIYECCLFFVCRYMWVCPGAERAVGQHFVCNKKQAMEKGAAGEVNEDSSCWQINESTQQQRSSSSLESNGEFTNHVD